MLCRYLILNIFKYLHPNEVLCISKTYTSYIVKWKKKINKRLQPFLKKYDGIQLNLSYYNITQIPSDVKYLNNLQRLYLNTNQLTQLPREIGQLTNLHTLYLYNNQLTQLP